MSVDCPFSQSVQVAFLLAVPFLLCGCDGQDFESCIQYVTRVLLAFLSCLHVQASGVDSIRHQCQSFHSSKAFGASGSLGISCGDRDLFSSLFRQSGDWESPNSFMNVTGEIVVPRIQPFGSPSKCEMEKEKAGFEPTGMPKTLVFDAVYHQSQRMLGDSSSPKDNQGQRESVVMSATRKQWLKRINGTIHVEQLDDVGKQGSVQASGSIQDKGNGIVRRVKVITPDRDKMQALEPLMRLDVRRLHDAKYDEEVQQFDSLPSQASDPVGSALLKPCFSPFETGVCAIASGTRLSPFTW